MPNPPAKCLTTAVARRQSSIRLRSDDLQQEVGPAKEGFIGRPYGQKSTEAEGG